MSDLIGDADYVRRCTGPNSAGVIKYFPAFAQAARSLADAVAESHDGTKLSPGVLCGLGFQKNGICWTNDRVSIYDDAPFGDGYSSIHKIKLTTVRHLRILCELLGFPLTAPA